MPSFRGYLAGAISGKLAKTPARDAGLFRAGDVVKAHFAGGQWYLATVEQDHRDGTFAIEWFDGEDSDRRKHASELRLMRFHDGRYVECQAEACAAEASIGEGGQEEEVSRPIPFRTGDIVKARYRREQYYLATVERISGDGSCEVAWLDGDTSERTKRLTELVPMRFDEELQRYVEAFSPLLSQEPSTGCPTENEASSGEEGQNGDEGARTNGSPLAASGPPGTLQFAPLARAPGASAVEASVEGRGASEAEPLPDLSELQHWVVPAEAGAAVFEIRDRGSNVVGRLWQGDIVVAEQQDAEALIAGPEQWLPLTPDVKVYRRGFRALDALPSSGGFVDAAELELRRGRPGAKLLTLRFLNGFGEPWEVLYDKVLVRRGPSHEDQVAGYMCKGDIVGVISRTGEWVELAADADLRLGKVLHRVRTPPQIIGQRVKDHEYTFSVPPAEAASAVKGRFWMMVRHRDFGELLRRCPELPRDLASTRTLSEERGVIYNDATSLIHRRIYEDNLEELWEGDREKLPSLATIERKLFEPGVTVIHAAIGDAFAGGAILKKVLVRAKAGSDFYNQDDDNGTTGHTTVGYIDSCAAVPGSHSGGAIWAAIASMDFSCVACHPILLESTVRFWRSRGLVRYDPSSEEDRQLFKDALRVNTFGRVVCELADLEAALPHSKLPLMVWTRAKHVPDVDPNNSYLFMSDEDPY